MLAPTLKQAQTRYTSILGKARELGGEAGVYAAMADLGRGDLYFLLRYILGVGKVENEWVYQRCCEVKREPNGRLDLWAREHFKSTIITFGLTIQDVLNGPEITVGIFSFSRGIAKKELRRIKHEFENNKTLKACYPDVLWDNPQKQAAKWSEDDGIVVKRAGNPKEATIEAWGLTEAMPTGAHYRLMVYDDVVTQDSVTTPEMIAKVTMAWEQSRNLTTRGGITRYIGTRYHHADTYQTMIDRESAVVRKHPATDDGTETGRPVLMSQEELDTKRKEMGLYVFGSQMLLDPLADNVQGFRRDWLQFLEPGDPILTPPPRHSGYLLPGEREAAKLPPLNRYLLVDPANSKSKKSDYTVAMIVGLGVDQNYYLLDMIRDRLNLGERAEAVFTMHRRWRPLAVGYEQYGVQADIQHLEFLMAQQGYRFSITPLGGKVAKVDRIRQLVPICEQKRLYVPNSLSYVDVEGKSRDLGKEFLEHEYVAFPRGAHDDMLDDLARILDPDLNAQWPMEEPPPPDRYSRTRRGVFRPHASWMTV